MPRAGYPVAELLQEILQTELLRVVEHPQLLPDLLSGVIDGAHSVQKVHCVGQAVATSALGGVVAGPELAPARRQVGPGIVVQLHLHTLQHVGEFHWQCTQLVSV